MARYNQGILGSFIGKVGNVVGSTWRGRAYMKALPAKVANPLYGRQRTCKTKCLCTLNVKRHKNAVRNASKQSAADSFWGTKSPNRKNDGRTGGSFACSISFSQSLSWLLWKELQLIQYESSRLITVWIKREGVDRIKALYLHSRTGFIAEIDDFSHVKQVYQHVITLAVRPNTCFCSSVKRIFVVEAC